MTLETHHAQDPPLEHSDAAAASPRLMRDPAALPGLASIWDAVAGDWASPMQQFAWIEACAATFAGEHALRLVVIGDARQPRGIAPLVARGNPERWHLLGVGELYEPADLIYSDPSVLPSLAAALANLGAPLVLERVFAHSPLIAAVRGAYQGRGLVVVRPVVGCPWIALEVGWTQPEQLLPPGRRSDMRRARRKAEEAGSVRYEVVSPTAAQLGPLLEEAFAVEAAGWKGREGTSLANDAALGSFYRRYAAAAADTGALRLAFMRIGGQTAAMQFAIECGQRFWLLKIGYDERFARCSPGALLMVETIRYAARRGLRTYEFLGTAQPWTRMWTEQVRPCVSLLAYPAGVKGALALAADTGRWARRRLRRVVRSGSWHW